MDGQVNAYTIAFGAGILTAAAVGDRLGRRRVYVFGLGLFAAASAACGLATDASMLIAFRAIQGIGAAIVMPLGLTILTSAFPSEKRGGVVGIWGGIAGLAVASGPLVGGGITQTLDWHWIFYLNVPIGLAATVGAARLLPESHGPRARLDVPAIILVSGGIGLCIWGLVQGGQNGWASGETLTALLVGAAMLAGFVWWESRVDEPMIPLGLFTRIPFSASVLTQFCMTASIFGRLPDQPVLSVRPGRLPAVNWSALPALDGHAAHRRPDRGEALGPGRRTHPDRAGPRDAGDRLRVDRPPRGGIRRVHQLRRPIRARRHRDLNGTAVRHRCRAQRGPGRAAGKAAGTLNTMQQFGAVFGIAVVTAVFNAHGSLATPATETTGYQAALTVAAGASVLGALIAIAIRRTRTGASELIETQMHDDEDAVVPELTPAV